MAIIKTEAIILKCDNYRETSKIVTFYTKSHGKLRGIAKGVRDSKTRWGGALQAMAYLNMMFYYKENSTLHLISGAEYIDSLQKTYDDHDKLQIGYRIVELMNKTTADSQENLNLFSLAVDTLKSLNIATKNYVNLLFNFEFKLLKILGFEIDLEDFFRENRNNIDKTEENRYFYETKYTTGDVKVMNHIMDGNFNSLVSLNISKTQEAVMEKFFENYFRDHFDHAGYMKTKKVFDSKEMTI
jgi:DNA repair protein RecO